MIVNIKSAYKSFGSQDIFKNLDLIVHDNEKVALIGANGVGKTTLFNILADNEDLDSGNVFWASNIRKGFLDQIHLDDKPIIVEDYFNEVYKDLFIMKEKLEALETQMLTDHSETILKQYDRVQHEFLRRGGYNYETEIYSILTKFNFSVEDLKRPLNTFSGGQITRLAFIRLLLSKPDVLLLDEPTNHLDITTIEWLEGYLSNYEGAVIVVSHDRLFLDRVCKVTIEIENYQAHRYESNYSGYQVLKEKNIERNNLLYAQQQKEIDRIEKLIEKFRYKSTKAAFAQSKIKYLDRIERIEKIDVQKREFSAEFKSKLRGGKDVLITNELEVGYEKPLLSLTHTFTKGRKYAIMGDNGTGKSTLIKTLAGRQNPLGGEILLGHQIEMSYFDQQLQDFTMSKTVLEEVWDAFPELDHTEIRKALGRFLFRGEEVFKQVSVLSGGEKVRVALVKLMLKGDNLLLLDEPTNHLDIQGKEALERALENFDGTMIFVSHDRYFIEKLATDIFVIKNGQISLTSKNVSEVVQEDKEIEKEKKVQSRDYYNNLKKLKNRQKKLEESLLQLYEDLEIHRELRFDPEYYHDYDKMDKLNAVIDDIHNEIKNMEKEWETNAELLEASED